VEDKRTAGSGREAPTAGADALAGGDLASTEELCATCGQLLRVDGAAVVVVGHANTREPVHATDAVAQQLDQPRKVQPRRRVQGLDHEARHHRDRRNVNVRSSSSVVASASYDGSELSAK